MLATLCITLLIDKDKRLMLCRTICRFFFIPSSSSSSTFISAEGTTNASIMDPNPNSHPILSYVMSRLPSIGPKFTPPNPGAAAVDIEQPAAPFPSVHVTDPNLFSSMANAVTTVYHTRSILHTLGPRPDHESLDLARSKLSEIDAELSKKLEETVLLHRPPHIDRYEWRAHLAERERELREAAEREKRQWRAIIDLDELHRVYEGMAREAEEKLVKLYETEAGERDCNGGRVKDEVVEVSEDVVGVLEKGVMERVELSGKRLRVLPDAFGSINGLLYLDVSNNQLGAIPDSIAALDHLLELNVSSNLMESLPDSIGLLHNLKVLNASSNKLTALPDSICHCRSLVELNVSFNNLSYLPTNVGFELSNLQRLYIQYNKIRYLPSSVCEMYSLRQLDAHFNEFHGLPLAIGKLTNLEYLNLSSNFSDLKELPETLGDLTKLSELDLSNNQIHTLPYTFGRLDNLTKLNLEQNPLVVPPMEVVNQGVEAVKEFMAKRWLDLLVEEETKSMEEANEEKQTGWLTRSTSWLSNIVSGVSGTVSGYIEGSPKSPRDPFLDQQL